MKYMRNDCRGEYQNMGYRQLTKSLFGRAKDGTEVYAYTLANDEIQITLITLGAVMTSAKVKDKAGKWLDVILGYEDLADYEDNDTYFGAVVGRNANRISGAECEIDGVIYELEQNSCENNLHSGSKGFSKVIWDVTKAEDNEITFSYLSPHMEQGLPGTMKTEVTYRILEDAAYEIIYQAVSDRTTIANMTHHNYFNLNGHESGSVTGQKLWINADFFVPVKDEKAIPTGKLSPVEGTPFDFRVLKEIGADIDGDYDQLKYGSGYDHSFVLKKSEDEMCFAAKAVSEESGIIMKIYTDTPGIQFYAGNHIKQIKAKEGAVYNRHQGFALEPGYFPNAVNEPNFQTPLLKAGEKYYSETKVKFKS